MFRKRKHPAPQFAAANRLAAREALVNEFIREVLGLPWAFVSDGTRLRDFEGLLEPEDLAGRVLARYGLVLEDRHFDLPLWSLLDELEAQRRRQQIN